MVQIPITGCILSHTFPLRIYEFSDASLDEFFFERV